MLPPALIFVARLLLPLLPVATQAVGAVPPFLARCLASQRSGPLDQGAALPTDSPRGADYGSCAARCEGRCLLRGDFDGDGRAQELALASAEELVVYHDVLRGRDRRLRAVLRQRLPLPGALPGDEVALVSAPRALRFAEEVGQLRGGKAPVPVLTRGEHPALGLLVWRRGADAVEEEDDEDSDDPPRGESGQLLLAIFDSAAGSYRLQPLLSLGLP